MSDLKFDNVVQAMPELSTKQRLIKLEIDPKVKKLTAIPSNGLKIFTRNSSSKSTHQAIFAMAKNSKSLYVRKTDNRINEQQAQTKKVFGSPKFYL